VPRAISLPAARCRRAAGRPLRAGRTASYLPVSRSPSRANGEPVRRRAFYTIKSDYMNFGYRELMTVRQLGLYAYENGFDVLRAGYIKAHNGIICRPR
jgi:hypothetical protein